MFFWFFAILCSAETFILKDSFLTCPSVFVRLDASNYFSFEGRSKTLLTVQQVEQCKFGNATIKSSVDEVIASLSQSTTTSIAFKLSASEKLSKLLKAANENGFAVVVVETAVIRPWLSYLYLTVPIISGLLITLLLLLILLPAIYAIADVQGNTKFEKEMTRAKKEN